jgi:sucrose phosphorylase
VPGIYVHSLIGSRSWHEGVTITGHNRTINRQKLERTTLEQQLADPASLRHQVFAAYRRLLRARSSDPAFHPHGAQRVLALADSVFALIRTSPQGDSHVLCLHNVSGQEQPVDLTSSEAVLSQSLWRDLVSGQEYPSSKDHPTLALPPYGVCWLKALPDEPQ